MFSVFTDSFVQVRHLAALLTLASVVATSGCAGGGSEEGPFISPLLDTDRATSAVVGPSGGRVQATGADGTQYTLTVPADALVEDTEISLTPILSVPDLPMSGGLIAGVHFEPSGLELQRAATLAVTPPSAPALESEERLAAFTYDGDGDNLSLAFAETDGDSFALSIHHFSGGGAGAATPSDLQAAFAPGSADAFIAELDDAFDKFDVERLESGLERWYTQRIKPALQAAVSSDQALERALGEYRRWLDVQNYLTGLADTDALLTQSHSLAAAASRKPSRAPTTSACANEASRKPRRPCSGSAAPRACSRTTRSSRTASTATRSGSSSASRSSTNRRHSPPPPSPANPKPCASSSATHSATAPSKLACRHGRQRARA